ncbi:MAG: hypothetical protein NC131_02495 [Roseburia sp.]|nr:hypothetical protein [Roseburia sp.]
MSFAKEEYQSLRAELQSRIDHFNTHNVKIITVILTVWTVGFSLYSIFLGNLNTENAQLINIVLIILDLVLIAPMFLLLPISVKTSTNLSLIASLKAYIMVFYELKSFDNNTKDFKWEIMSEKANLRLTKKKSFGNAISKFVFDFVNGEYVILMLLSFAIFMYTYYMTVKYAENVLNLDSGKIPYFISMVCFLVVWFLVFFIVLYSTSVGTHYKKPLKKYSLIYLDEAIEMGYLSNDNYEKYKEFLGIDN